MFRVIFIISLLVLSSLMPVAQAAQEKPQVLLMMSNHAAKPKGDLLKLLAKDQPFELVDFKTSGKSEEEIKAAWSKASLILLDGINPALSKWMFSKYESYLPEFSKVPVISLGDLENDKMNQGVKESLKAAIGSYYNNAGRDNYRNMMLFIANDFLGLSNEQAQNPIIIPKVGLYHYAYQGQVTDQEQAFFDYLAPKENQPVIAIGMHKSVVDYEQQQIVDAMIKGLEAKGAKALGFFFEGEDEAMNYTDLLSIEDEAGNIIPRVDLLINYRSLHFVEKRRGEFERLGVPVLHAINYTEGSIEDFEQDHAGISPTLTPFFLVMPEDTGSADPTIVAVNGDGAKQVIPYQMAAFVERAYNHANLAHIENSNKKVATFIWNYPPGEKNIGAAFLDVPSSIEQIALAMKEKGYNVDVKTTEYLIESAGRRLRSAD